MAFRFWPFSKRFERPLSLAGQRSRRWIWRRLLVSLLIVVAGCVWLSYEFPSITAGRRSSAEILSSMFRAPVRVTDELAKEALTQVGKEAVVQFVRENDLPPDVEKRIIALVRSERVETVTLPFVYYLHELYGAPAEEEDQATHDLAYEETATPAAVAEKSQSVRLSQLVRQYPQIRKHVRNALLLFDSLFLRVKPNSQNLLLHERYDEEGYRQIKELVRAMAQEMLPRSDDVPGGADNDYAATLQKMLQDDAQFSALVEFFTDFVRDLSDSWLESFVHRAERRRARLAWVQQCIDERRNYEIADWAAARMNRRLVFHLAVDGLQGKLLEGLAQLSAGNREASGARYVAALVHEHFRPEMSPASYPAAERVALPPLGNDIVELAQRAPSRPDFLPTFKKHFFDPGANSVVVNVATVDTPTISVRNLPIIYTGHPVAGRFGTGIPNFSYLDRRTGRGWYFWGSDILHFRRIFANREDEIPAGQKRADAVGARTLFERLWRLNTVSAMPSVDVGALDKISAEVGLAVGELKRNYIEKVIVASFRRRARVETELNRRRQWLAEHRDVNDSLLGELIYSPVTLKRFREYARYLAEHEDEGIPDYVLWYNPWPDHFAHGKGPYSDEIVGFRGEYNRLDFYLGKLIEVYRSVETADANSTYADRTLFGVVSDHGLVYTPRLVRIDRLLFDALAKDGVQVKVHKLSVDEGAPPMIRGGRQATLDRPYDAVVGSTAGGSYVIDVFAGSEAGASPTALRAHPDYHQLRQHRLLGGQTIDWIDVLNQKLKDELDFSIVREDGPAAGQKWPPEVESVVRIVTPDRGEARIHRFRPNVAANSPPKAREVRYRYELLTDSDPLNLTGSVRDYLVPKGKTADELRRVLEAAVRSPDGFSDDHWRELLSATLRADSIYQLSHLYDSDRAGTINLFPKPHVGINSSVPGRHAGESFGEKNGTQLYHAAGLDHAVIQTARNGSLPVTLYHWLAGDEIFDAPGHEGDAAPRQQFGFPTLLDHPAFARIR
jgi:hypothetical protein